ncbi:eukaryotic mitochondrial regulator protein-domain-containing protein [Phycomyces nitens]|nr:eukaryotic mitochondrial regulator protein-domain-containing protein [Phycomyces nitens]
MLRSATSLVQGITTPLTARTGAAWASQRLFSNTAQCYNDEPTKATEETPESEAAPVVEEEPLKTSRRRRRFHDWVRGQGARFTRPALGTTNYLGPTPFPNNPLFQPRPPLTDARRQEIYDVYVSDPENWTIRKLATKFGLSLKRVDAILKLKDAEKEMSANGIALQRKFAKSMEQLMGADMAQSSLNEPLVDVFPNVGKPKFKTIEEDAVFAPEDAAKALNRKVFKELENQAIQREEREFASQSAIRATPEPKSHTKRSTFVIVDTSN